MVLLDNDLFLSRLTLMFDKSRSKGHVSLCMKRYDGRTKPNPRPVKVSSKKKGKVQDAPPVLNNNEDYMCLVRATCKNEKISSVVHSKDVNKFQLAYCNLLKSNMDGLKRQKKVKTKKQATQ